jgi:hypothetical protein
MSGAIVAFSTRGITGLRQPKTRAPDAKSFQSLPITRITGPFQSVQEFTPYVPHTESVSSLYATERVQETWITSGRPAHRSSNDGAAQETKMCEEPKIGSTSDGYRLFNRYGLFSNGVNRASSCISGVALAGLVVGTSGASGKCSTPITARRTGP